MSLRKLLLVLGVVFIGAGLWLAAIWVNNRPSVTDTPVSQPKPTQPAALAAIGRIPSGTLLREGDLGWKELSAAEIRPEYLMRGVVSETEFIGAITRRDFAAGELLIPAELVKPSDRRFLAAVLRPGYRAVSISVDAPQTASGLVLPGDFVDVILVQNFGDNVADAAQRSAGETILQNVRVVALDQLMGSQTKAAGATGTAADARVPKTITLEADERQAQKLYVAMQLGKLQLAVRPLEGSGKAFVEDIRRREPVWASDVSLAIRQMSLAGVRSASAQGASPPSAGSRPSTGSSLEHLIRRPPPAAQE